MLLNTVFESAIQSKEIQYSIDTNVQHKYAVCDKTKLQEIYLNYFTKKIEFIGINHLYLIKVTNH